MHLFGEDESKNIRPSHSTHVTGKSLRPSLSRQSRSETDHLRTWPNARIYPKHEDVIIGPDLNISQNVRFCSIIRLQIRFELVRYKMYVQIDF